MPKLYCTVQHRVYRVIVSRRLLGLTNIHNRANTSNASLTYTPLCTHPHTHTNTHTPSNKREGTKLCPHGRRMRGCEATQAIERGPRTPQHTLYSFARPDGMGPPLDAHDDDDFVRVSGACVYACRVCAGPGTRCVSRRNCGIVFGLSNRHGARARRVRPPSK